jgi:hypothetical protein
MTNEYIMAEPFYKQEILRNVSIGYTPYMPFTQQYKLDMDSDFAGRGTGYMAYGPNDEGDDGADATGYGWDVRRNVYMGLGEGRLAHMSSYYGAKGRWGIANQVAPQESAARAGQKAMDFKEILENNVGTKVQELIGSPVPSRIVDEIGLANLSKMLDTELVAQKKMPKDIYEAEVNRRLQRGYGFSSQGFDLHLEEHKGMARFLASNLNNFDETVRSMEVSRAKTKGVSDKAMMNIKKMPPKGKETSALRSHVGSVATRLNRMVRDFVSVMTPKQEERFRKDFSKTGAFGALRTVLDSTMRRGGILNADKGATLGALADYKQEEWKALKQFLDRGRRNEAMSEELKLTKHAVSHVYQNMMPNGFVGLSIMRTGVKKLKGFTMPFFKKPLQGDVIALSGGADHSLANAMALWALDQELYGTDISATELMGTAYSDALGQAILGAGRAELINAEAMTGTTFNVEQGIYDLRVGGINSTVSLVPTEIAKNLYDQIMKNLNKGGGKPAMQRWFQRLITSANDLSKSWYDRMPHGMRASMSEEFQFGDDKGNPNKRFLGVWNQGGVGAWQGDVGQNISMAPFIIARRQKVANWRDGGFQADR